MLNKDLNIIVCRFRKAFGDKYDIEAAESGDEALEILAELTEDDIEM